jgi:hypothetical protein
MSQNILSIFIQVFIYFYRITEFEEKSYNKRVLNINKELQEQIQATIDGLKLTEETNNRTTDALRNTDKSNNLIIQ